MKTRHVLGAMVSTVLLTGTMAYAQQDDSQGPGARGNGPDGKPEGRGMPNAQMQPMRERGGEHMRSERMGDAERMRHGQGREGGHGPMVDIERAKQAGATEQKLEALKTFMFEQQVKRIDLQATVDKAELVVKHLMQNEAVDEKSALKAADALIQARGELFKLEISDRVKVGEILGAEVLKKMHERPPQRAQCPRLGAPGQCAPGQGNPPNPPPQGEAK